MRLTLNLSRNVFELLAKLPSVMKNLWRNAWVSSARQSKMLEMLLITQNKLSMNSLSYLLLYSDHAKHSKEVSFKVQLRWHVPRFGNVAGPCNRG